MADIENAFAWICRFHVKSTDTIHLIQMIWGIVSSNACFSIWSNVHVRFSVRCLSVRILSVSNLSAELGGHRFHAVSMSMSTPQFSKISVSTSMYTPRFLKKRDFKKVVSTSTPRFSMSQVQSERSKGMKVDGRAKLNGPSKSRRSWAKLDGLLRQSER